MFTCIGKEALPLVRYRTRDICKLSHEPCSCGRTLVKMSKTRGRTDDMLIIRGINVFPIPGGACAAEPEYGAELSDYRGPGKITLDTHGGPGGNVGRYVLR